MTTQTINRIMESDKDIYMGRYTYRAHLCPHSGTNYILRCPRGCEQETWSTGWPDSPQYSYWHRLIPTRYNTATRQWEDARK